MSGTENCRSVRCPITTRSAVCVRSDEAESPKRLRVVTVEDGLLRSLLQAVRVDAAVGA